MRSEEKEVMGEMWGLASPHAPKAGVRTPAPAKAQGALPRARPADSPVKMGKCRSIKDGEDEVGAGFAPQECSVS